MPGANQPTGSTNATPAAGDAPRVVGTFTSLMAKALNKMSHTERQEFFADAQVMAETGLSKAGDLLDRAGDMSRAPFIEDQWNDNPGDRLDVTRAHGPGSSAAFGDVPIGPSQAASGNGAQKMEREYSRPTPQHGITASAELLGREVAGIMGAMKSMVTAIKGVNAQVEMLKSAVDGIIAAAPPTIDVDAAVSKALEPLIVKALAPIKSEMTKLLAKAEEKEDDGKEDDEEAKHASVMAKADDKKKDDEWGEEEDDKKEKSAALLEATDLRIMAKARLDWAKLRLAKAQDLLDEKNGDGAKRQYALAGVNIEKAERCVVKAIELRGTPGDSSETITRAIAKAKKKYTSIAENQDVWPNQGGAASAKSDPAPVAAPAQGAVSPADLAKAMEKIDAAVNGLGVLSTNVAGMMQAMSGSAAVGAGPTDPGRALPPVFALAKANTTELNSREAELNKLAETSVISFEDKVNALDVISRSRMGLPEDVINVMVKRLPQAAQQVLTRPALAA